MFFVLLVFVIVNYTFEDSGLIMYIKKNLKYLSLILLILFITSEVWYYIIKKGKGKNE